MACEGADIFDGQTLHQNRALVLRDGRFAGIVACVDVPADAIRVTLEQGVLAPGLVDLQVNGGGGVMLNDAPDLATLRIMAEAHARLGATAILPTLITDTADKTRAAIDAVGQARRAGVPGIAGLHLEGPHLSQARKGAHDGGLIRPMAADDLDMLVAAARDLPVLVLTLAPESVTPAQMQVLARAGAVLSLGHSDCQYQDAQAAIASGVTCVTHLFNAMRQHSARSPGLIGAALDDGALSAGVIADLVHVHPASLRMALAAKRGPGALFLVSDAMAVAGSDLDHFHLNGRRIDRRDGRLTLGDGTLAGADLDLPTAIANLVGLGVPLTRALAMATSIPAGVIRNDRGLGRMTPGQPGDFIWLDRDLRLGRVWRDGQVAAASSA